MKTRSLVCFLVILIFGICTQYSIAEVFDWPRWRGPNGDGISMETEWNPEALASGPKILWNIDVGKGVSNVVIKDNYLFTMGYRDKTNLVYCLNAETGEEIWRYPYEGKDGPYGPQTTPIIDEKNVYILSNDGMLICIKVKNGKSRWVKDLVNDYDVVKPFYLFSGSPIIEEDLLIITANTFGIALNKKTGEIVWNSERPAENIGLQFSTGPHYATPVVYDQGEKRSVIITSYKGVYSVEVETGYVLWLYMWEPLRDIHVSDPLVSTGKVFVANYKSRGCTLLDITNEETRVLWQNKHMSSDNSSPIMVDGYIYGVDGGIEVKDCTFQCLDSETGELMWEKEMDTWSVTFIAADNKLIMLEEKGILRIVEATPSSYKEISHCDVLDGEKKFRRFWTLPVLCNRKIYCRNVTGDLVCMDVSK